MSNGRQSTIVTNPEQRWVPENRNGSLPKNCRRHLYDCTHFFEKVDKHTYTDQEIAARLAADPNDKVSFVREATPDEMRRVPPCSKCGVVKAEPTLVRHCPRCFLQLPAAGECDCDS